ncbi:RrF2 family transcriptional regulator [Acutalibacter caecimuris]|uniref:RrF2 family transcriptional regulator n=1 Tax=Acutalibacter caecimuris TaxID=3093657 RepID=UPI002AC8C51D|nr:Rrf2 family transcriptional regulator [Acutalibacter sp. M00118]
MTIEPVWTAPAHEHGPKAENRPLRPERKRRNGMVMTLEADYAVRIVEYLTRNQGRQDAGTISEKMQVPMRFCLKILRGLVKEGLVCSFKGAKGGYCLARPAGEITLLQVIESVEGPYMLSRCQEEAYSCGRAHCRLHTIYEQVSGMVRRELGGYTFAAICREGEAGGPDSRTSQEGGGGLPANKE